MAKGNDTSKHPNRRVDWDSLLTQAVVHPVEAQAQAWMNDPAHAPSAPLSVEGLSPETIAEFGLNEDDKEWHQKAYKDARTAVAGRTVAELKGELAQHIQMHSGVSIDDAWDEASHFVDNSRERQIVSRLAEFYKKQPRD